MRDETAAGVAAVLAARKKIQLGQHVGADVLMGVDVMTAPGDQLEAFDL